MLLAGAVETAQAASTKKAIISGFVRVAEEDARGNVLAVEIVVGDEEEPYLVSNAGKGKELFLYIGQWVLAGGKVSEDELGWKTIEVQTYDLAEQYPDR